MLGCNDQNFNSVTSEELLESMDSANLDSRQDVVQAISNAANSSKSVIFVNLKWSLQSAISRRVYSDWVAKFSKRNQKTDIAFHYIDATSITSDYSPFEELPGWRELQRSNNGRSLIGGYGELVWISGGRVVDVKPMDPHGNFESFNQKTLRCLDGQ